MKLKKVHNTCYADHNGYYMYDNEGAAWVFLPLEKYYTTNDLLNISNIINIITESHFIEDTEILKYDGWGEYVNLKKHK